MTYKKHKSISPLKYEEKMKKNATQHFLWMDGKVLSLLDQAQSLISNSLQTQTTNHQKGIFIFYYSFIQFFFHIFSEGFNSDSIFVT